MMRVNILQVRGMGRYLMKRSFAHKSPEGSHHAPGGCHSSECSGTDKTEKPHEDSVFNSHHLFENLKNGGFTSTQVSTLTTNLVQITSILNKYQDIIYVQKMEPWKKELLWLLQQRLKLDALFADLQRICDMQKAIKKDMIKFTIKLVIGVIIVYICIVLGLMFAISKIVSPSEKEKLPAEISQ